MNNTKRFILKQIYEDMEISRKEIAAKLNLSKTIVGKYINNFIIFNIDDGVGAGEIGHTPYNYSKDAPICSCGNKGYLETYLANWQVINRVKKE
ncbi:ROK family protein [Cetobacterium ceti]